MSATAERRLLFGLLALVLTACAGRAATVPGVAGPINPDGAPSSSRPQRRLSPRLPVTLLIPSIGVDAPVEQVGETADGDVGVPLRWTDAAWFDEGYYPGTPGNAVILGHLDTDDSSHPQAVFWNLARLTVGAEIDVVRQDGSERSFRVTAIASYPVSRFPMAMLFGPSPIALLRLMTCAGRWRGVGAGYDRRLVVTAALEGPPDRSQ